MYEKTHGHVLDQSVSSLYSNLDVLTEDNQTSDGEQNDYQRLSFLTASKTQVNIVHKYNNGMRSSVQVANDQKVNKHKVLQAKWCHLSKETVLVIANYNGMLIFDAEGKLLMFWHGPDRDENAEEEVSFYRGIACVNGQHICVGTNTGKVLVLCPEKNSFHIRETLEDHIDPLSTLFGLQTKPLESEIDFVSADDGGAICTYKSGQHFSLVTRIGTAAKELPCTSVQLLPNGLILAGYLNGHIRMFNASNAALLADVSAHVRAVSCLDATLEPENNSYLVLSGSEDSFIRIWKISTDDEITVSQEWYTSLQDLQVCGGRFCDSKGQKFFVTGYDVREVFQFSRIY